MTLRYRATDLTAFVATLFKTIGADVDKAEAVARAQVAADLMGHTTHGLQLVPYYLDEAERGAMAVTGVPEIVADHGACLTLDGRRLPGAWLLQGAIDRALERIGSHGVATVVMRNSHHIGCLATYLERATEAGYVMLLTTSDAGGTAVAAPGGTTRLLSTNPIAMGIPTGGEPLLIDISMSTTSGGTVYRALAGGSCLPGPWLVDGLGRPTDDPTTYDAEPPGAILPLGGVDLGYKGFALCLMVEALAGALGGFGRADHPPPDSCGVFLQIIDPEAFGARAAFAREVDHIATLCRSDPRAEGQDAPRLPGDRALALKRRQLADGVALHPGIMPALRDHANRLGVAPPMAIDEPEP